MPHIRVLGLDLDGTLLDDRKRIGGKTMTALERAYEQGVAIVPVTGRPHEGIPALVRDLPFVRYIISCNGATIRDMQEGLVVRETLIPVAQSLDVLRMLQEEKMAFEVLCDGVGHAEGWVYERLIAQSPQNTFLPTYVKQTRRIIADTAAFVAAGRGLEEFFVMPDTTQETARLRKTLEKMPGLHVVQPAPRALEITAAGVDKGASLLHLAGRLGASRAEVMAMGDSGNDLAMLKAAGLSVAMGNATDEVKALADYLTETNENDGVAQAVERFILV